MEPGAEVVSRVEDGEEGVDVHCPRARAAGVELGQVKSGQVSEGGERRGGSRVLPGTLNMVTTNVPCWSPLKYCASTPRE